MDDEDRLKTLLSINYNKLLAYLAGAIVSIFTLFQIATEATTLHSVLVSIVSTAALGGGLIFVYAGYINWKEIIGLENDLGLSRYMNPSSFFSKKKNDVREVSPRLKIACWLFGAVSAVIWLYNISFLIRYLIDFF